MGKKRNYRTPEWSAVLAALISGVITHLFGLVNVLHNYDDIAQQPKGYGTGITSGRWFLSVLGDLAENMGGNYNLPVVNGLLFLLLMAVSAGILVGIFHIRSRMLAGLAGMLFVVFPTAFSTLVFRYTAVYYGIGILLSVIAAWSVHLKKYGLLLSAICTAFSLGIYQAYVPVTIGIFVLLLIQQALEGNTGFWKLVCRGCYYCMALVLGLVFYYILLKVFLALYGTELSNYQGMDQMGRIPLREIPQLVKEAAYSAVMLPVKDYCGISNMGLVRAAYLILELITVIMVGYILTVKVKRWDIAIFTGLMFLLLPIAVNFIVIMCPDSWIYTLMLYSFVLIPCVPIVVYECIPEENECKSEWVKKCISIATAVLVSCYAYQTNVNYTALHYSNRQIENYLNSLVTQVRMTDGFSTDLEWAFIGEIDDPLLHCYWQYEMTYGGIEFTEWMLRRYSVGDWIRNYYGYTYTEVDEATTNTLSNMEEVKNMPCWPNEGSIRVMGNTVVIKCQNVQ